MIAVFDNFAKLRAPVTLEKIPLGPNHARLNLIPTGLRSSRIARARKKPQTAKRRSLRIRNALTKSRANEKQPQKKNPEPSKEDREIQNIPL